MNALVIRQFYCRGVQTRMGKFHRWSRHLSTENVIPYFSLTESLKDAIRSTYPLDQHTNTRNLTPAIAFNKKGDTGDYQTNAANLIARSRKLDIDETARTIVNEMNAKIANYAHANVGDKGFINISMNDEWMQSQIRAIAVAGSPRPDLSLLSRGTRSENAKVLIDFASPNMGKELHVGHLRSCVIGDTLSRILEYCGAPVDRISHIGDCGVPVGIVLQELLKHPDICHRLEAFLTAPIDQPFMARSSTATTTATSPHFPPCQWSNEDLTRYIAPRGLPPSALSELYVAGKQRMEVDVGTAQKVQRVLQTLQSLLAKLPFQPYIAPSTPTASATGGTRHYPPLPPLAFLHALTAEEYRVYTLWRVLCHASLQGIEPTMDALGVTVQPRGESTYAPLVPGLVQELLDAGLARTDDGAVILPLETEDTDDGERGGDVGQHGGGGGGGGGGASSCSSSSAASAASMPPVLLQKRDGAFLYATTDLACLRSRLLEGYTHIVYVTDASQSLHFRQVFAAAARCGWVDPISGSNLLLPHHPPVALTHVPFGLVRGEGGKKLSSRTGTELSLAGLLEEGVAEAVRIKEQMVQSLGTGESSETDGKAIDIESLSRIAYSAIRVFDLLHKRESNYAFSFPRALSLKGNSAAYLLYAAVRLQTLQTSVYSLFQSCGIPLHVEAESLSDANSTPSEESKQRWMALIRACSDMAHHRRHHAETSQTPDSQTLDTHSRNHPSSLLLPERHLATCLLRHPETVLHAARLLQPQVLAEHALDTASALHTFYDKLRVLPRLPPSFAELAGGDADRMKQVLLQQWDEGVWNTAVARLYMCAAAENVLRDTFALLGIQTVSRM